MTHTKSQRKAAGKIHRHHARKWYGMTVTTLDPETGVATARVVTASTGRQHLERDITRRGKITNAKANSH